MDAPSVEIRVRAVRPGPSLLRLRWTHEGRVLGERRLLGSLAVLHVPPGRVVVELLDERAPHDPRRQAPARRTLEARAGERHDVLLGLCRGASLRTEVRDHRGAPARFAEVEVLLTDGSRRTARADGAGVAVIAGLHAGPVQVRARRRGRVSAATGLTLRPGQPLQALLVLTRAAGEVAPTGPTRLGGAVRGRVVDAEDGTAVARARVELVDARGQVLARGRTDAQGVYVLGGDLPTTSGLTVRVRSGADRAVVDTAARRGVAVTPGQLTELGALALPRSERRVVVGSPHPRGHAALRLPSLRV